MFATCIVVSKFTAELLLCWVYAVRPLQPEPGSHPQHAMWAAQRHSLHTRTGRSHVVPVRAYV